MLQNPQRCDMIETKNNTGEMRMSLEHFYEQYFPFWKTLSEKDQRYLCENTAEEHFEKEQPVHNNMGCAGLFIVRSGRLRIYMLSEDGKEITLYCLAPGELCMLAASCVLQSITFDVYVDAEMPSDCYRISAAAFGDVSERYLEVKNYGLEIAVQRFSDVMWVMQQIVFMSMDKRLAIFLLDECSVNSSNTVMLTHEQIARHLGTAREVITRLLKQFANDGIVQVTRKEIIIIDKNRLRSIAG
jgi:CRP/FNR family transcriptional regulator